MERRKIIWLYAFTDYLAAVLAWFSLYMFRKMYIEGNPFDLTLPFNDSNFYVGVATVPQVWLFFHYLTGTYVDLYKKSRLQELGKTIVVSLLGTILIFFALLLDDYVRKYSDYYLTFFVLLSAQVLFTFYGRLIILNKTKRDIWKGRVGFDTLMVGNSQRAFDLYESLTKMEKSFGFRFSGFIQVNGTNGDALSERLKCLGTLENLESILIQNPSVEEVIIAIESSEHHLLNDIINRLADKDVTLRIIPDMYDILSGTVKMNHVVGEGFIELPPQLLNEWERITKRWFDVLASAAALFVLMPVMIYVALRIKLTDGGPVFYKQERLGRFGKPFMMYKFRSMYLDAEKHGPALTSENDPRITPIGQTIRKYRIDEFAQFWNVIRGDMSIVGPRAERRYFADKIIEQAPYYRHVFRVQPGITSLGMVKFGYASTVDEMIKRLKYDIIYIENMSIVMDLKIMVYTVQTVLYGRGK